MFKDYSIAYPGYKSLSDKEKRIVIKTVANTVAVFFPTAPKEDNDISREVLYKAIDYALISVTGLSYAEVFKKDRLRMLVDLRKMVILACYRKLDNSKSFLARMFDKNHATIIYSIRQAESLIKTYKSYETQYNSIYQEIEQYLDNAGLCKKGRRVVVV